MARFVPNSTVTFSPDGERIEIANLSWHVGMVGQHLQTRPMNIPFYAAREDRFRRGCAILGLLHTFFAWNAFDTSVMPESTNCRQDNNMDVFTGAKDYPASRCWCAHVWDAYTHQDTEVLRLRLVKFLLDIGDGDASLDGDDPLSPPPHAPPDGGDGGDGASPSDGGALSGGDGAPSGSPSGKRRRGSFCDGSFRQRGQRGERGDGGGSHGGGAQVQARLMECRCGYVEDVGCDEKQFARQARRARITPAAWSAAEDGCYHSIAWPPCGTCVEQAGVW
jgi:hypothetical protein